VLHGTSPFVFTAVKQCGAAYLIYLGARLLAGEPREKVLLMIVQ
jgi:threonine/homoserine/homoserine lactone efflux protein